MAHHKQGDAEAARKWLDDASARIDKVAPKAPGEPARAQLTDWLEAQGIRREAEELLRGKMPR